MPTFSMPLKHPKFIQMKNFAGCGEREVIAAAFWEGLGGKSACSVSECPV